MAADLVATSNDGAADPVQQQHQPRDQSNRSKLNNEEAATATAAGKAALYLLHLKPCPFHNAVNPCSCKVLAGTKCLWDAWCKHAVRHECM